MQSLRVLQTQKDYCRRTLHPNYLSAILDSTPSLKQEQSYLNFPIHQARIASPNQRWWGQFDKNPPKYSRRMTSPPPARGRSHLSNCDSPQLTAPLQIRRPAPALTPCSHTM